MSCGGGDEVCAPPDVCANADDTKEEFLLRHETDDDANLLQRTLKRDKPLIIAIFAMAVIMRIPYLKFILYPFRIFSTWVHEMCHGLAAVLVGGGISKLMVYKDGSGLAYTYSSGEDWKIAFVASAGYTGTALIGGFLLLWRRTHRGPTVGLIGIGCSMILSVALCIRNTFGIVAILLIGIGTILCGWKLKAKYIVYLYSFLAATCSFNALDSIDDLLAPGQGYVNGEPRFSDAHTVADYIGMTYAFWAVIWLIFAIIMSLLGLVFAFDGHTYKKAQREKVQAQEYSAAGSVVQGQQKSMLPVHVF